MSSLIWTGLSKVPAVWSLWWRNSVCFYICCFYFCHCAMSHTTTVLASNFDILRLPISNFTTTGHSTFHDFTFLVWPSFCHSSDALEKTCNVIFYHYSGNIYTTLSKLHLAGDMFRHLSTPHGMAGGLASIKCSTAKIGW